METLILKGNQLDKAAQFIRQGELVAFPTETVYGLGADATNEAAVKKKCTQLRDVQVTIL